jgi:hypothetical protein
MDIKVREVSSVGEKSAAEREQELLEKHQQAGDPPSGDPPAGDPPAGDPPADDELKEEQVLAFIGKRYNKQINSFDELMQQREDNEQLPEDVAAFLKYKKDTGRGINEFLKLQENFDTIDDDTLLKRYFLDTEEGLEDDDVDVMMGEFDYDEDIDDDSHVKKVKLAKKKAVAKAKAYFSEMKEKYKAPLESSASAIPDEEKENFEAYKQYVNEAKTLKEEQERKRQWFQQKTDEVFSKEFKGFEFDVEGRKIVFSPGDAAEIKKAQESPMNFIAKFLDENGLMVDATGYHRALSLAMNPDRFAKFFYEQGAADAKDDQLRKIKNVNMGDRKAPQVINKGGVQVREVNPDQGRGLKIKSAKRL